MTTSQSPLRTLTQQADKIADVLKRVSRGERVAEDRGGKLKAAMANPSVKFGVIMDDKLITLEMTWDKIKDTSEVAIAAYILKLMRNVRETSH